MTATSWTSQRLRPVRNDQKGSALKMAPFRTRSSATDSSYATGDARWPTCSARENCASTPDWACATGRATSPVPCVSDVPGLRWTFADAWCVPQRKASTPVHATVGSFSAVTVGNRFVSAAPRVSFSTVFSRSATGPVT